MLAKLESKLTSSVFLKYLKAILRTDFMEFLTEKVVQGKHEDDGQSRRTF